MARFLLSSLIIFIVAINFSAAASFHKRAIEAPHRYCDHAFLEKSTHVVKHMKMSSCVTNSWPTAEWYGQWPPKSKIDFREFCCKVGCSSEHFTDYTCYMM